MERNERSEALRRLFTLLVRHTIQPSFRFPGAGAARRTLEACIATLDEKLPYVGSECLVDFCVSQAYRMACLQAPAGRRWTVAHAFGKRAVERYLEQRPAMRYFEDRWLESCRISREALIRKIERPREHPYACFLYPEYEEPTKRRRISTPAGYAVCCISTLLWTPFSPSCRRCSNAPQCRDATRRLYPELFRLRCQAWQQKGPAA